MSGFPTRIPASTHFEGKEFHLWNYEQLSGIGDKALKARAMDVRDQIGAERLERMPRDKDGLIAWMIMSQVRVMGNTPTPFSAEDFGLPSELNTSRSGAGPTPRGEESRTSLSGSEQGTARGGVTHIGRPPSAAERAPPSGTPTDASHQDASHQSKQAYMANKNRNNSGSSIFG